MIKAHKGAPPPGWENVPGMTGFIREKTEAKSADAEAVLARLRGPKGDQGPPGKDGRPGRDGNDGESLVGIRQPDETTIEVATTGGGKHRFTLPRGPAGEPGQPGQPGVSVSRVFQDRDGTLVIRMTDGTDHRFDLPARTVRVLGGGGGAGAGAPIEVGPGLAIDTDAETGAQVITVLSWMHLVGHWDAEPTLVGATETPVPGEVYAYTLGGVTRYRLVPGSTEINEDGDVVVVTEYDPHEDAFYSDEACTTDLIVRRDLS